MPFDTGRIAALIGTSGTTGTPKLVALEGRAMAASALGSALRLGSAPDDCWFVALPAFHVGGLAIHVRAVLFGTAVALPGSLDAGFQPQAFVGELEAMIQSRSGEIERFERNRERWRDMSEAEREEAREQMKRLREMSVEERRELLREMEAAKRR